MEDEGVHKGCASSISDAYFESLNGGQEARILIALVFGVDERK
jgi:ABC-type enterochelin transport system ATPase subunit